MELVAPESGEVFDGDSAISDGRRGEIVGWACVVADAVYAVWNRARGLDRRGIFHLGGMWEAVLSVIDVRGISTNSQSQSDA